MDDVRTNDKLKMLRHNPDTKRVAKVGFCLHMAEMINHYAGILKALGPDHACLLIADAHVKSDEAEYIRTFARMQGLECMDCREAMQKRLQFSVLVSNHPFCAGSTPEALLSLGRHQVRMMYGLGKAKWNFAPWNSYYHTVLCWGRFHADNLRRFEHLRIEKVGYPRFDPFFNESIDRKAQLEAFGLDPHKLTVLWLPTWGDLSSIDGFAAAVAGLKARYNVILKLHTLTCQSEPERLQHLKTYGLENISDPYLNNVHLIAMADIVLADYGGSLFAGLYAHKRVLLLNVSNPQHDPYTGDQSLDLAVRSWLPNVDPADADRLAALLADDHTWIVDKQQLDHLRNYLFEPNQGTASEKAADILRQLLAESESEERMTLPVALG